VMKNAAMWMIVLPVKPVILQVVDPRETLSLPVPRHSAAIKSPAVRPAVEKRPGSIMTEELECLIADQAGEHANGFRVWTKNDHDWLPSDHIE